MHDTSVLTQKTKPTGKARAVAAAALLIAAGLGLNGCAVVSKLTHNANRL